MATFIDEILADVDWRIAEFASIKSIPIKYSFRTEDKELHIKYSVTSIYAIWEGFVKNAFTIYSEHLNSLEISRHEISYNLLTHRLDSDCNFSSARHGFDTKKKLVEYLDSILTDIITIKPCVPTDSNVNLKVLNRILERFCVPLIDDKYSKGLDKLLLFRNKIAHGENALKVSFTNLVEFVKLIENLMLDITINIEHAEKTMTYKIKHYA